MIRRRINRAILQDAHLPHWLRKTRRTIAYQYGNYIKASTEADISVHRVHRILAGKNSPRVCSIDEFLAKFGYRLTIEKIPPKSIG